MKRVYRSIFLLGIGLGALSCKNTERTESTISNIAFTKEGTAQLFKQNSDSILSTFDLEFARTEYETQTGLMYRNSMANHQAMLFIFEAEAPRSFYMKNTRIPLDIIYLSSDLKIVSFHQNAEPFNEASLPSNEPAKYVLEINGGLMEQLGIGLNDRLEFQTMK